MSIRGKVALITGSTRGIGEKIAKTLAGNGCRVVIMGKSRESTERLPGSVYSVSKEIGDLAYPLSLDIRDNVACRKAVDEVKNELGRIDYLINNASAMWWKPVELTDWKHFDLLHDVNVRATYGLTRECLPHLLENGGHVVTHSPPLEFRDIGWMKNKVAYTSSKVGMTLVTLAMSVEYQGRGVGFNTIWPNTAIESYAVKNNGLGDARFWRKPDIIADSIHDILKEDSNSFNGNTLIDESYLRSKGVIDFSIYNCVEGSNPPPLSYIDKLLRERNR